MKIAGRLTSRLSPLLAFAASLGLFLCAFVGESRAGGEIAGKVSNANTGEFLAGAEISVEGHPAASALTGQGGSYEISNLAPGSYTVHIDYTGLDQETRTVVVEDGRTTQLSAQLTAAIYKLEAVTVAGVREGNAASLTEQRNSNQVMNSVSTDAFGDVADGNIGNMLVRLPGVEGIQEVGDVVGISVRGLPPDLNTVNIDGVRSAAAASEIYTSAGDMGDRAVPIDQIPSDFIKEVQVIKAITPDMPADSIGGVVNLITKSALDVREDLLTYRFGGNINTYRTGQRTWKPVAALTYLGKIGRSQRLGIAFSTSYTETANGRDRIQMTRNYVDNYTSQARTLNDWADRLRSGANLKMDYQLSDNIRLTFGASYTYYSFHQPRYDWNITANSGIADYSKVSLAQIEAGAAPQTTAGAAAGIAPGYSPTYTQLLNATFTDIGSGSQRHTRTYKYDAGADIKWPGDQTLVVRASYSPSWFSTDFQTITATRTGGIGMAVDSSANIYRPTYVQTYGPTIGYGTDLTAYKASRTDSYNRNNDSVGSVTADYEKKFAPAERFSASFKAGVDYQAERRDQAPWSPTWTYTGTNIAQFQQAQPGYGLFNNQYPQRDALDWPSFMRFFNANPGQFTPAATVAAGPQYSQLEEDIGAAYVMGTITIGQLRIVGGLRGEQTNLDTSGLNSDPDNPTLKRLTATGEYKNYFPSIHFRYEPIPDLVLRSSVSTSEGRPSYTSLYPNTVVTYNTTTGLGTVVETNPALKPEYSRNYDASAEYYSKQAGVLSANWFYKDISNYLFTETDVIGAGAANGFNGQYEGFNLSQSVNGGEATVKGYELNFMRQFTELPKPFNTIGINANYTAIKTEGNYGNGVDELLRFIPRSANLGVVGSYKGFEARVSYNMKGGYLYSYSSTPYQSVRTSGVHTWDLNLKYQFSRRLTIFADVVNIFNKWESWYTGTDPNRVVMAEIYGTRLNAGFSGRW